MRVKLPRYTMDRVDGPTRHYRTPDGVFPSVTAILSATKDISGLEAWRRRVGDEEAERIRTEACARGEWLHGCIERYLESGELPAYHWSWQGWWNSAHQWISSHIGQPLVLEAPVYSPAGFSGTLDALCEVDGEVVLCDWKNALRPKKPQHLEDYLCQLAAYRCAAHHVYRDYGLQINTAYCVIALDLQEAQVVRLDAAELMLQEIRFMERLDEYNQKKAASSHG